MPEAEPNFEPIVFSSSVLRREALENKGSSKALWKLTLQPKTAYTWLPIGRHMRTSAGMLSRESPGWKAARLTLGPLIAAVQEVAPAGYLGRDANRGLRRRFAADRPGIASLRG